MSLRRPQPMRRSRLPLRLFPRHSSAHVEVFQKRTHELLRGAFTAEFYFIELETYKPTLQEYIPYWYEGTIEARDVNSWHSKDSPGLGSRRRQRCKDHSGGILLAWNAHANGSGCRWTTWIDCKAQVESFSGTIDEVLLDILKMQEFSEQKWDHRVKSFVCPLCLFGTRRCHLCSWSQIADSGSCLERCAIVLLGYWQCFANIKSHTLDGQLWKSLVYLW